MREESAIIKESVLHENLENTFDVLLAKAPKSQGKYGVKTLLKAKPNLSGLLCMWPYFEVGEKGCCLASLWQHLEPK